MPDCQSPRLHQAPLSPERYPTRQAATPSRKRRGLRAQRVLLGTLQVLSWLGAPTPTRSETNTLNLPIEYSVRRWNGPTGPVVRGVEAIHQTQDGYLWFGMNDGLYRFDGIIFQRRQPPPEVAPGLDLITSLAEDQDGTLWVGSAGGGLIGLREGTFTHEGPAEGLANEQVKALQLGSDGRLWIGTDGGGLFARDRSGRYEHFDEARGLPEQFVMGLTENRAGELVIVTYKKGPYLLRDGQFTSLPLEPPPESQAGFFLTRSPTGHVWLGTPVGVYHLEGDRFVEWQPANRIPGHDPMVVWERNDQDIWIGTAQGLVHWRDGSHIPYLFGGGSSSKLAGAFQIDHEGSVWAGTEGAGLVQLRRTQFVTLGAAEQLATDEVTTVLSARDGSLWIGTAQGLQRAANGQFQTFSKDDGLVDDFIFSLAEDASGAIWVSTRLGGLARQVGNRFVPVPNPDIPKATTWCLTTTRDGSVWAGTSQGAVQYRDDRVVARYHGADVLSNDDVRAIAEDHDGTLWIGTSYGLNQLRDGLVTQHTDPPDSEPLEVVITLHVDEANDLWIGTLNRGLFRYRAGAFANFTSRQGLPHGTIASLADDTLDHLWLGTSYGILRVPKASLAAVAEGRTNRLADLRVFNRADGLRSEECSATIQPTVARGPGGRLWFATAAGLSTIHPLNLPPNPAAPLTHIERIAVEGPEPVPRLPSRAATGMPRTLPRAPDPRGIPAPAARQRSVFETAGTAWVRLPPGQERIEFQFVGLSYLSPETVAFRYQLEGFDQDWVDSGTRRAAYYTRVPPGRYTFRVQATQGDSLNGALATLAVDVQPAWWQTFWLRTVAALAGSGALASAILFRLRNLQREREAAAEFSQRLIRSQELERARLAGELHDGLAQELQVIRNRAELALEQRPPEANVARELLAISAAAARAIQGIRALTRGLRPPELDQLGLTEALRWLGQTVSEGFAGQLEARIEPVDGLLPRDLELQVYRVAQEALNNALKHSQASEITLEMERTSEGVRLSVFDNGSGFEAESTPSHPQSGSGLKTMRERAAMLRASLEIRSAPGVGTRITLLAPIS